MKIKAKDLVELGVEVDLPIEWDKKPPRQCTIRYDKKTKMFVMSDIRTGELHYSYPKLSDLLRMTNEIYGLDDIAVENV